MSIAVQHISIGIIFLRFFIRNKFSCTCKWACLKQRFLNQPPRNVPAWKFHPSHWSSKPGEVGPFSGFIRDNFTVTVFLASGFFRLISVPLVARMVSPAQDRQITTCMCSAMCSIEREKTFNQNRVEITMQVHHIFFIQQRRKLLQLQCSTLKGNIFILFHNLQEMCLLQMPCKYIHLMRYSKNYMLMVLFIVKWIFP